MLYHAYCIVSLQRICFLKIKVVHLNELCTAPGLGLKLWFFSNLLVLKETFKVSSHFQGKFEFKVFSIIHLGYVYMGSDMIRSIWDQIHYGTDPLCLHGTSLKLERHTSTWGHLLEWNHLVPDSRSNLYWIHAYLYQIRTGSKWMQSHVKPA